MVKIITVHGTNAGDPNDVGDQWWQIESDFQRKLRARIAEPIEFVPYHWSGANSERVRREAGEDLAKKLKKESTPPIVIGHSHGGSVALHALLVLFLKNREKASDYFRSLVTVGTPMIRYRGAWNPMFRFNILGQLFLIYAVLIGLLVASTFVLGDAVDIRNLIGESLLTGLINTEGGFWGLAAQFVTPAVLFASVLPIAILYFFARRSGWRNRLFADNSLLGVMRDRYIALNHSMDEAITALRTGVGLKLKLVDRKTVRTALFAPIALSIAAVLVLRTVSETVNIESLTAETVINEEMMDAQGPVMAARGEEQLALRDLTQRLRYMNGDIRRNADATGRIRRGLTRQTVYLRNDYLVMDLGTVLETTRSKADLLAALRTLSPTAKSRPVSVDAGKCVVYGIYMTSDARDDLIAWAESLPDDMFFARPEGLTAAQGAALNNALLRGSPTESPNCPIATAAMLPGAAAVSDLLDQENLLAIADRALVTARGPSEVIIQEQSGLRRKAYSLEAAPSLSYPALESGEAVVFERSAYNDVQITCLLDTIGEPIARLTPWEEELSNRQRSLTGLCAQVEGGDFTAYDFATTIVGEVEYNLENVISAGVAAVDQYVRFGGSGFPSAGSYFGNETVKAGILSPFYFVTSVLIVTWIFATIIAVFVAPVLSGVFNSLIRKNIFGNDGHGELVQEVAPGLDFDATTVSTLPANVEKDLVDYVQEFAPQTIARVREIISLHTIDAHGALPITEISEALTWKELIHTAYFDVDSFVDHIADQLVETAGLTRRKPSA